MAAPADLPAEMEGDFADITDMPGVTKAAIFLMKMGKERAAKVLRGLRDSEVASITSEIARLQNVPADKVASVLREFRVIAAASRHVAMGGVDFARELLEESLGAEKAHEILDRLHVSLVDAPFEFLRKADSRQLLGFLQEEHPQTIALVLAHMPPDAATDILTGLEEDLAVDVTVRLATMDRTSPDIIAAVEESLQRRLSSVLQQQDFSVAGGVGTVVEILNRVDQKTQRGIMEGLEAHSDEIAEDVRRRMFVFEDIVGIDDRAMQQVLRAVNNKELAMALKGTKEQVRQKIFSNVSSRAAQNLAEEIDMLGSVRLKTVEDAQAGIIRVIRALEESGQITVARPGADEFVS